MIVSKQSMDKALRAMQKDLLRQKEIIDSELDALTVVIRMNEKRPEGRNRKPSGFVVDVTNTILEVLQEESPLHRNDICARVREKGVHIGGENPVATIGTYLSSDDRFTNVSRGMWAVSEDIDMADLLADSLVKDRMGATAGNGMGEETDADNIFS